MYAFPKAQPVYWWGCGMRKVCTLLYYNCYEEILDQVLEQPTLKACTSKGSVSEMVGLQEYYGVDYNT